MNPEQVKRPLEVACRFLVGEQHQRVMAGPCGILDRLRSRTLAGRLPEMVRELGQSRRQLVAKAVLDRLRDSAV
jgi:hypothetical protein